MKKLTPIVFMSALILIELVLFCAYFQREIVPYPPEGWDQTAYYINSFGLFETLIKRDWGHLDENLWAQGILVQGITALSYFIFGVARINGPLFITLIWLLLQYILYTHFLKRAGVWAGWLALGLFLTVGSYFRVIGGLVDFRLDAPGGMLYGMSLVYLIESQRLKQKTPTNLFILSAFATILARSNIVLLLGPVLLLYVIFLVFRREFEVATIWKNLWLATKLITIGCLLCSIAITGKFYRYYLAYYFTGDRDSPAIIESMNRIMQVSPEQGWDYKLYPVLVFVRNHLGPLFLIACALSFGGLALSWAMRRRPECNAGQSTPGSACHQRDDLLLGSLYFAIPICLYTLSVSRNPVVETTLVIPTVVLTASCLVRLRDLLAHKSAAPSPALLAATGVVILSIGIAHAFSYFTSTRGLDPIYETPERMARDINALAKEKGIDSTKVVWLDFNDMSNTLLEFYGFLQDRHLHGYNTTNFYAPPSASRMGLMVAGSELVIVNEAPGRDFKPLPFNQKIEEYRQASAPALAQRFIKFGKEYTTIWGHYGIYVSKDKQLGIVTKPAVRLKGAYPDWLGKKFSLEIPPEKINFLKRVIIAGESSYYLNKDELTFSVRYVSTNPARVAQSIVVKPFFEGTWYRLSIDIPGQSDICMLVVAASHTFVPKQIGLNEDTRELVLQYPSVIEAEEP
jgi:hypothetical protein